MFMQVLQLDLCNRCPHGHTSDWLTGLEYFFSLFTLARRVWVLLRAIVEALNFSHSEPCGDPRQDGHTNTHSASFPPKHTRTQRPREVRVQIHTTHTHTHPHNPTLCCQQIRCTPPLPRLVVMRQLRSSDMLISALS